MINAITERSGFLSVEPRPSATGGTGQNGSSVRNTLPLIQFSPTRLSFDPDLNRVFFQFRDTETGEVTREVPPRIASQAFEITAQSTEPRERATLVNFDDDGTPQSPVTGVPGGTGSAETPQAETLQGDAADQGSPTTTETIRSTDA